MSEENKELPKPEITPEIKPPSPEEIKAAEIKAQKEKSAAEAKLAQEKVGARIAVLKGFEGKSFKSNFGNQTSKVLKYFGIIKNKDGNLAHAFDVVFQNPSNRAIVPAGEFLDSNTVFELKPETVSEVI